MWAIAAMLSDSYAGFKDHFYSRARKYLEIDEMRGNGEAMVTLAHCQTWVLVAMFEFQHMHFPRAWLSTGRAMRLCQMGGLDRLDNPGLGVKETMPPSKDWTEKEERRRAYWATYWCDRCASIGTGWPMTIDERDVSIGEFDFLGAILTAFTRSGQTSPRAKKLSEPEHQKLPPRLPKRLKVVYQYSPHMPHLSSWPACLVEISHIYTVPHRMTDPTTSMANSG